MDRTEALEKLITAFEAYYDIKREGTEPFAAEAEFSLHDEQYFLIKSARISEVDTKEFVYFASVETLSAEMLARLDETAWERGIARVQPHADHRNSDVILYILADHVEPEAMAQIKKLRHYKSYRHGFHGWSHYRLAVIELSSGKTASNRQGRDQEKLVNNIIQSTKEGSSKK